SQLESFNVQALVSQVKESGAHYFMISIAQNTPFTLAPNSYINDPSGNTRDIIMELGQAFKAENIPFFLYWTANPLKADAVGNTQGDFSNESWVNAVKEYANR